MKKVNEKNDDFLMKICGFWIDFEADSKPSILRQDKAHDFRALKYPKTPSGKACRLFDS